MTGGKKVKSLLLGTEMCVTEFDFLLSIKRASNLNFFVMRVLIETQMSDVERATSSDIAASKGHAE